MEKQRITLALDLGTTFGWAIAQGDTLLYSGEKNIGQTEDYKFLVYERWWNWLHERAIGVDEILYEKVMSHQRRDPVTKRISQNILAAHTYGAFEGMLTLFAGGHRIPIIGLHNQSIKKQFTGSGKAKKIDICRRCHELGWQGGKEGTDRKNNEADARAMIHVTLASRGIDVVVN